MVDPIFAAIAETRALKAAWKAIPNKDSQVGHRAAAAWHAAELATMHVAPTTLWGAAAMLCFLVVDAELLSGDEKIAVESVVNLIRRHGEDRK